MYKPKKTHKQCVYPYPHLRGKKYQSYERLLFERQVCDYLCTMNSNRNYYDTSERLQALRAKNLYESKIPRKGNTYRPAGYAKSHQQWIYPGKGYC